MSRTRQMPGFRYVSRRLAIVLGAMLAALLLHLLQPAPAPFGGSATVVDGDTIRLAGERVRLVGLDAPELAQSCTGADGRQWSCGTAARRLMRQLVDRGKVTCAREGYDRYDRVLARCSARGADPVRPWSGRVSPSPMAATSASRRRRRTRRPASGPAVSRRPPNGAASSRARQARAFLTWSAAGSGNSGKSMARPRGIEPLFPP